MVRVWRRRLLGGMATAVLVPGGLLASLAVLAAAGGFGGLSALGQAFSGPPLPFSQNVAERGPSAGTRVVPASLVAALSAPTASPRAGATAGPVTTTGGASTTEAGRQTLGGPAAQAPIGSGRSPAGGRTRPPAPPPKPQPTVVDRVVSAGTAVTSQIPGPAGPVATKALQAAGSTLDSIAPIKSR